MNSDPTDEQLKAKVMLFGTFHFSNPALDLVRSNIHNVKMEASQSYLEELAQRISQFQPTTILLEYDPKNDQAVNERYTHYCRDNHQLSVDEVEQLGFRIARATGLARLESFDHRDIRWQSEELFRQLKIEIEIEARFNTAIEKLKSEEELNHSTLSLRDLLKRYNSPALDRDNKSLYILTNAAGVDQNFAGADAAASWWHRNFRMLAKIQKFAAQGARLLVIGGQGHMAVIRDLIDLDPRIIVEDVRPYL